MSADFRSYDHELIENLYTVITWANIVGTVDWIITELTTNFWSVLSIVATALVGVLVYALDKKRRKREEEHARKTVVENLNEGSKLFAKLTKTARRPASEEMESEVISEIDYFFQENHEKIRDIIRFTRIYLNEWKNLPAKDKARVELSLKDLYWLLTDYYPMHKPDLIKHGSAIENRATLSEKNEEVLQILQQIKSK